MNILIPGSKSLTNRALLLAAAATGTSRLRAPLESEDTLAFRDALEALGAPVRVREGDPATAAPAVWELDGLGGGPALGEARIWCRDAGTAARFLPPFAAVGRGRFRFDGSGQLRARPLGPLLRALTALGAEVSADAGGLPFELTADGLDGGRIDLRTGPGELSSQYLSALLMSGPLMRRGLLVEAEGLVSRPYVEMTVALMRRFGAEVVERADAFAVPPGGYTATDLPIEPDASTASYFFAAAAITARRALVRGLGRGSLQGDLGFVEVLRTAGAHVEVGDQATAVHGGARLRGGFVVDMGAISDTFMTLTAIAPLADAPITITGVGHARLKESDRVDVVARNLAGLGVEVDTGPDWITVRPGAVHGGVIACHRDHRIAMAFSVLGLRVPGIVLDDPSCVAKTFPGFHREFGRVFPQSVPTGSSN